MNILFLYQSPFSSNKGGVERVSLLLAQEFQKMGHQVSCLSLCDNPEEADLHPSIPKFYINPLLPDYLEQIDRLIKNLNVEVIINQSWENLVIDLLKKLNNKDIKILSVLHNQPFSTYGKERIFKYRMHPKKLTGKLSKWLTILFPNIYRNIRTKLDTLQYINLLSVSDYLILLSANYIPRITKLMPDINPDKLIAINNPNTFDIKEQEEIEKENILLYVGRLEDPQKNLKYVIDIWNDFYRSNPDWELWIVGSGKHEKWMHDYVKSKKSQKVLFKGNKKDVTEYYKKAKLFCMTSIFEGWPMVLAEAIANKCIPVAFNSFEALPEILDYGKSGKYVAAFDKKAFVRELADLSQSEDLRENIINNGMSSIKKFELSRIANQWNELFNKIKPSK